MPHIHEKIDFTVNVYIVHDEKVLLRKHDKYGIWIGVGGHVELHEDVNEAALREAKEEVGLDITLIPPLHWKQPSPEGEKELRELTPPHYLNLHQVTDVHKHEDLIYFATSTSNEVIPENLDDVWQWCTREEVETHPEIHGHSKSYALAALEAAAHLTTPE